MTESLDARDALEPQRNIVSRYGDRNPADYGGSWFDHAAGGVVCALVKERTAEHARALRKLVPDPSKLRVEQAAFSWAELERVDGRIGRDLDRLFARGVDISSVGVSIRNNRVMVGVRNHSAAIEAQLRSTYGDAIEVGAEDVSAMPRPHVAHRVSTR